MIYMHITIMSVVCDVFIGFGHGAKNARDTYVWLNMYREEWKNCRNEVQITPDTYAWLNMRGQQWQTIVPRYGITPSSVVSGYIDRIVKQAIELGPKITLTETVAWYPVTNVLRRNTLQNEHLTPSTITH